MRWDPEQENVLWLTQAASLNTLHYYTQFAVHRPFIAASRRESPLSFPSVIICTNGARSSIQVLEVLAKRTGSPGHRNMVGARLDSTTALILISGLLGDSVYGRNRPDDEYIGTQACGTCRKLRKGLGLSGKGDRHAPVVAVRVRIRSRHERINY